MIFHGYHGTYRSFPPTDIKDFGGIYVGTHQAAIDRLVKTFASTGGGAIGRFKPGLIYPVTVHCEKAYGSKERPINETELFSIVGLKSETERLKIEGYSCVFYENIVEDPGSVSVLVFYRAIIDVGEPEIVNIKKIYDESRWFR